jgi:hypothetical protein
VWLVVIGAIKVAIYHYYDARELGQSEISTPLDPFAGRLGKLSSTG